ncbi:MAG: segregation/condensation protein A [Thermoanaerobacteraceae bacterium]|nr:segregation/condensation protein A [Thermoanaerobacteraceae bacterium]
MDYKIKLELYEGPYELLYHLIKNSKVNIYDISFVKIIDQYMQYVDVINENNPELRSNFFLITSSLLELKSRLLLPETTIVDDTEENIEIIEINKIFNALEEYKKYKNAAKILRDLELKESNIFYRKSNYELSKRKKSSVATLVKSYQKFKISSQGNYGNNKRYMIREKLTHIIQILRRVTYISFSKFIKNSKTREDIISYFIALLELEKRGYATTSQSSNFGNIIVKRGKKNG